MSERSPPHRRAETMKSSRHHPGAKLLQGIYRRDAVKAPQLTGTRRQDLPYYWQVRLRFAVRLLVALATVAAFSIAPSSVTTASNPSSAVCARQKVRRRLGSLFEQVKSA